MKSKQLLLAGAAFAFLAAAFLSGSPQAHSAPVPKMKPQPPVTISVSRDEKNADDIVITLTNCVAENLEWKYKADPLSAFDIDIRDESGKKLGVMHPMFRASPHLEFRVCSIKPQEARRMPFSFKDCFQKIDVPDGKLTVLVTFKHGKDKYEAAPLVIDR